MKTLFRVLGAAAAVAVTSVAIVALDKVLNDKARSTWKRWSSPKTPKRTPERRQDRRSLRRGRGESGAHPRGAGCRMAPCLCKRGWAAPEPEAPEAAPAVEAAKAEKAEATAEPEAAEEKPAAGEVSVNPVEAGPRRCP